MSHNIFRTSLRRIGVGAAASSVALAGLFPLTIGPASAQAGWPICTVTTSTQTLAAGSAIDDRYNSDPALRALLGAPTGPERESEEGGVFLRDYAGPPEGPGILYSRADTGVHEVHGLIKETMWNAGGHRATGVPITDECPTATLGGRYSHFSRGGTTPEASIYWRPGASAHWVHDYGQGGYGIHRKWADSGWENGRYGWPTTNTMSLENGWYNHFTGGDWQGASIYWSPQTGPHGVNGLIRARWASLGWERSYLGYPVSDEYDIPGGKRSDFVGGCVTWNSATGAVTDSARC
ncbi:LGFP repeat-containing protein [Nocardia sp. NPDC058176]|uniref:LGFP repeat-containing protein n=1 Tax=Nocardia sp. NPDC058176 TaxID=3346368 RepID=UPI0036D96663